MPNTSRIYANAVMEFTSASADNSAATVTLAAVAGKKHIVRFVSYYYDTVPAAGDRALTIAWTLGGVAKTYTATIQTAGAAAMVPLQFPEGFITGDVNTAVTITLAASGTGGSVGFVNVFHRK